MDDDKIFQYIKEHENDSYEMFTCAYVLYVNDIISNNDWKALRARLLDEYDKHYYVDLIDFAETRIKENFHE